MPSFEAASAEAFAAIWPIYSSVIERSEQKTESEFRAALANPAYRLILAREAGQVVGFSLSWAPPDLTFALLEYLAVAADRQGSGVGASLAGETFAQLSRTTLIEADDAAGHPPASQQARRLRFYARQGCRRIAGLSYILPLEANGRPPPMLLLAHNAPAAVPAVTLRAWLTCIYVEVYAQRPDDPRIGRMMEGLPAIVGVTEL